MMPMAQSPPNLLKNPVPDPPAGTELALLAASLRVVYLRGGETRALLRDQRQVLPFTLIGQSCDVPLRVQLADQAIVPVPTGGGYILPAGQPHRVFASGPGQVGRFRWAHLHLQFQDGIDLFHFCQSPAGVSAATGRQIGQLNLALLRASQTAPPSMAGAVRLHRLCARLLTLLIRCCPARAEGLAQLATLSRLEPVFQFMREHLARPVLRDELAHAAGLSPSRFHALFQQSTGRSPLAYLTQLRLQRAQEILLSTNRPIAQVAEAVGFRDPFHFTRTFTRTTGMSPRRYRVAARDTHPPAGS